MSERGEASRGQEPSLSYGSTPAPSTLKPQGVPTGALPTSSDPQCRLLLSAMLSGLWGGQSGHPGLGAPVEAKWLKIAAPGWQPGWAHKDKLQMTPGRSLPSD